MSVSVDVRPPPSDAEGRERERERERVQRESVVSACVCITYLYIYSHRTAGRHDSTRRPVSLHPFIIQPRERASSRWFTSIPRVSPTVITCEIYIRTRTPWNHGYRLILLVAFFCSRRFPRVDWPGTAALWLFARALIDSSSSARELVGSRSNILRARASMDNYRIRNNSGRVCCMCVYVCSAQLV